MSGLIGVHASALPLGAIQSIDKHELHLHLGGAWPIDYLLNVSTPSAFNHLNNFLDMIENGIDYHEGFHAFDLVASIVDTEEKVRNGVEALCKTMIADGVYYLELRTGLKNLGQGEEAYLLSILNGIDHATDGTTLTVKVLLSLRRNTSQRVAEKTFSLYQKYSSHIIGLDISGDSTIGNGDSFMKTYEAYSRTVDIPLTLHLGESPKETPAQQMHELRTLKPRRIGHGVHLCEEAITWIRKHKIPVEMCLTSALRVRMIEQYEEHPGLQLHREGHPVVVSTDDPLIFRKTLSEEIELACGLLTLSHTECETYIQTFSEHRFWNPLSHGAQKRMVAGLENHITGDL